MKWIGFVNRVYAELKNESRFFDFNQAFEKEQQLTRVMALGLRKLFAESYNLPVNSEALPYHVLYRQGDTQTDKLAWTQSKLDKWISFHGVRFVPDILIRRRLDDPDDIYPIEIKLIKKPGAGQSVATSIGQALIYSSRYPEALVFIGIKRSIKCGRYKLRSVISGEDELLYQRLSENNVRLIMKEVN